LSGHENDQNLNLSAYQWVW